MFQYTSMIKLIMFNLHQHTRKICFEIGIQVIDFNVVLFVFVDIFSWITR
jgi:hypothetical protein